jgi:hypothetical protein
VIGKTFGLVGRDEAVAMCQAKHRRGRNNRWFVRGREAMRFDTEITEREITVGGSGSSPVEHQPT